MVVVIMLLYGASLVALSLRGAGIKREMAAGRSAQPPFDERIVRHIAGAGVAYALIAGFCVSVAWFRNSPCGAPAVLTVLVLAAPAALWAWTYRAYAGAIGNDFTSEVPSISWAAITSVIGGGIGIYLAFAAVFSGSC
jgi:hypothetical protein